MRGVYFVDLVYLVHLVDFVGLVYERARKVEREK